MASSIFVTASPSLSGDNTWSGDNTFEGTVDATAYAVDGTPGVDATVVIPAVATLTITKGLVTVVEV